MPGRRGPTNWGRCPACQGRGYNELTLKQCKICDKLGWLGIVFLERPQEPKTPTPETIASTEEESKSETNAAQG